MRVITISTTTSLKYNKPMCACIGYFDGMHLGHQKLVKETVKMAKEKNCESALITFDPDPRVIIQGKSNIRHITTIRQRINRAVSMGISNIVILQFSKEMSELAPEVFVRDILGKLNLKGMVCGFDFRFGYRGSGDAAALKEIAGFDVVTVDPVEDENGKISSTRICELIRSGDMMQVRKMLGDWFQIEGTVIHGRHQGTGIGFPTANIKYSEESLLPRTGVYAGFAWVDSRRYKAMINVGHNPTFNYKERISIEAHLIDCDRNLYGKHMILSFAVFLRDEKQFRTKDNLIMQLEQDVRNTEKVLQEL